MTEHAVYITAWRYLSVSQVVGILHKTGFSTKFAFHEDTCLVRPTDFL